MNFLPRRVQYLLLLTLSLWCLQGLFRLLFWGYISDLPVTAESHLIKAFWIGLRFDLRVSLLAALSTLPWLFLPRFSAVNYALLRRLLGYWFGIILIVILTMYVFDAGHYLYLSKRIDASIVRFSGDIGISSTMVWQSYPVIQICLGMVAVWLLGYRFHSHTLLPLLEQSKHHRRWYSYGLHIGIIGALFLLILFGRWSLVPLRWNHAFFNGNAQVAALGLNPFVWIYDTARFTTKTASKKDLQPHFKTLSGLLGAPFPSENEAVLDRWETPTAPVVDPQKTPPNVVIVFMESLGASHIGAYGNALDPTPNIDALIKQSRWYPHFNVPARSTAKSVFTSITGIPDVSAIKTATRNPYITHQRSVINSLVAHEKYYMLGGSAGWANMSALIHNSIEGVTLYEEKYWTSPIIDVWGISDHSLISEASAILKQAKTPFLGYIQTAANHEPYTIAEDYSGFVAQQRTSEELKDNGFSSLEQFNAVRLLDHNIGKMFEIFKRDKLYDNTIFVIFSDHQASSVQVKHLPEYIFQFGMGELPVPLIIHAPNLVTPEIDNTFGSLPDLLPTIAGLFPQPYLNTTLGRDLAWAKGKNLPAYGFVQDSRTSVAVNGKQIASVNHITGEVVSADIDEQGVAHITTQANPMADAAKAYYLAAQYLLKANVTKPQN
jgi:phosphoglycerol transferase MdoB-like AlkP superfamily enzyme